MEVMPDGTPRFLNEYEVEDTETRQMKCRHDRLDTFTEDTGDSRLNEVLTYEVTRCLDCDVEWSTF